MPRALFISHCVDFYIIKIQRNTSIVHCGQILISWASL